MFRNNDMKMNPQGENDNTEEEGFKDVSAIASYSNNNMANYNG
jgi:hypothetical protein